MGVFFFVKKRIRKELHAFKKRYDAFFIPYKGVKKIDLLLCDNIFPHPISGFRLEEFSVLLNEFDNSKILMTSASYPVVNSLKSEHLVHINDYLILYPSLKNKLKFKKRFININAKLFYCVFVNNIYPNLHWLEKYKIPFVFTLYPGGGFQVEDLISDMKLKRVFSSPQFRKVIVTQLYTRDYLINKNLCSLEKIEYIFGGVVPQISLINNIEERKFFLKDKNSLDICFCAAKYMPKGMDKGYDVFIKAAISLFEKYNFIRFHVIGGFDKDEIDVSLLGDKIIFHGYQKFEDLAVLYNNMDIIVSPNKPFFLGRGAFDGFPLGTVVEAVFNGVVALVTDKLHQNTLFVNNEEIIIIESTVESIEKEIINLINKPEKIYSISKSGRKKFLKVFSNAVQMHTRIELLKNEIAKTTI